MRISDWSSDVCSSDLPAAALESEAIQNCAGYQATGKTGQRELEELAVLLALILLPLITVIGSVTVVVGPQRGSLDGHRGGPPGCREIAKLCPRLTDDFGRAPQRQASDYGSHDNVGRSEEHPSELQSLMRIPD